VGQALLTPCHTLTCGQLLLAVVVAVLGWLLTVELAARGVITVLVVAVVALGTARVASSVATAARAATESCTSLNTFKEST
jgi:hypothetical protein